MKSYSQNGEDLIILDYFKGFKGTLLSIGENDGTTFSNSRLLIESGWKAHLFEPGNIFKTLKVLHKDNTNVSCFNFGIGNVTQELIFWESGAHVPNGEDSGLVSTANYYEMQKWASRGVIFTEMKIAVVAFKEWYTFMHNPVYDFISIDAEGMDWMILQEIDLINTQVLCIEWNSDSDLFVNFTAYCSQFGLKLAHKNSENLIFLR